MNGVMIDIVYSEYSGAFYCDGTRMDGLDTTDSPVEILRAFEGVRIGVVEVHYLTVDGCEWLRKVIGWPVYFKTIPQEMIQ